MFKHTLMALTVAGCIVTAPISAIDSIAAEKQARKLGWTETNTSDWHNLLGSWAAAAGLLSTVGLLSPDNRTLFGSTATTGLFAFSAYSYLQSYFAAKKAKNLFKLGNALAREQSIGYCG